MEISMKLISYIFLPLSDNTGNTYKNMERKTGPVTPDPTSIQTVYVRMGIVQYVCTEEYVCRQFH